MSTVLTEKSVKQYIRTMLGEPVVKVELTDEQLTELINQALDSYGTYKPVEKMGTLNVLADTQKYTLTANQVGRGIVEWFPKHPFLRSPSLDQFDVFKYHSHLPNLEPGDYFMERQWWKAVRESAGSDDDWEFILDPTTGGGTFYISPSPSEGYTGSYIYVVDPTLTEVPTTDDDWIKDYALAMAKQILGHIRRKFGNVQGAETSLDLDGAELISEGTEARRELEEYLTGRGQIIAPIRG